MGKTYLTNWWTESEDVNFEQMGETYVTNWWTESEDVNFEQMGETYLTNSWKTESEDVWIKQLGEMYITSSWKTESEDVNFEQMGETYLTNSWITESEDVNFEQMEETYLTNSWKTESEDVWIKQMEEMYLTSSWKTEREDVNFEQMEETYLTNWWNTESEDVWIKHYCNGHEILLVGEGDFSFAACLAKAFGSAHNIVATSLDSLDEVLKKYKEAKYNLQELKKYGATVLFGIDVNYMRLHNEYLKSQKFDRIVYNFPHAGFKGKEDSLHQILLHRQLVSGFFKNAKYMLRPYGEVHVTHKVTYPYCKWKLEELAGLSSLVLEECDYFSIYDYPGYKNKRGDGSRCDEPFPLGECRTFKFRIMRHAYYRY